MQAVSRLLVPGKPDQSRFLIKPLADGDGPGKHGGGDLITKGDGTATDTRKLHESRFDLA